MAGSTLIIWKNVEIFKIVPFFFFERTKILYDRNQGILWNRSGIFPFCYLESSKVNWIVIGQIFVKAALGNFKVTLFLFLFLPLWKVRTSEESELRAPFFNSAPIFFADFFSSQWFFSFLFLPEKRK